MPDRIHILELTGEELTEQLVSLRMPAFRGEQVRRWLFEQRADTFELMTNLSKLDRSRLAERFEIASARVAARQESAQSAQSAKPASGVVKLLLTWPDESAAEAVMIPAADRRTACISSQVGCPVGCKFCASGLGGLVRNLTAGQIVEQAWQLSRLALPAAERLTHVVFMGIGEPLANYDAVVRAIRLLNAPDGLNIGARKITVSTVGLPAPIRKLAAEGLQVTLAISLHAPNQPLREQLIPWAKTIPLDKILSAARDYFDRTGREITLEYLLIEGVNSLPEHADQLADLAHTLRCNVNLISYNPVADLGYQRPAQATVRAFRDHLVKRAVNVHIRPSRGLDIDAACGQLRQRAAGAESQKKSGTADERG